MATITLATIGLTTGVASAAAYTGTFHDLATGFCLDGNDGGAVYTGQCNGGNYQNWRYDYVSGAIRNAQTGRCLTTNVAGTTSATGVYTAACNGTAGQQWASPAIDVGTSTLHSNLTGRCLDSSAAGSAYTLPCNGGNYQLWNFFH